VHVPHTGYRVHAVGNTGLSLRMETSAAEHPWKEIGVRGVVVYVLLIGLFQGWGFGDVGIDPNWKPGGLGSETSGQAPRRRQPLL
jgi:hypothetical protein